MTGFNDLPDAGAHEAADRVAIVRGNRTLRQLLGRLLTGVAFLSGAAFTGAVSGPAPTAGTHLTPRDFVEALAPEAWGDIAAGSTVPVKKVVVHSGQYYGCITEHAKGATGPDGDPDNWLLMTNYGGAWSNKWWARGTFVSHNGYAYLATARIPVNSPAPDAANNVLWLLLGTIPAGVVSYAVNTIVTAAQRGWTFRATGATARALFLVDASGADEVPNGWDCVVANGSTAEQAIRPNASDTIGGNANLMLAPGRVVRLQKVATGVWILTADTKDETGGAGAAFMPTKANLYAAVKAIFSHNTAVSPDDANNELDVATGAAAALGDNTIAAIKAMANDAGDQKAWRLRIGAWHLDVTATSALPAVTNFNPPDGIILGQSGNTGTAFVDTADRSTDLNVGVAGDFLLLLGRRWVRVTNIFTGGAPLAAVRAIAEAAQAIAEANRDRLMVALTQGDFYGGSAAAIQGTYHINVESMPGAFPTANKVEVWIGDPGIARVLSQAWDPAQIQRNLEFEIAASTADNLVTNNLVTIGNELGVEIRLIAPGDVELYRKGFDFPIIAKPASARARFERAVGASPAVLPAGTEEIVGHMFKGPTRTDRFTFGISLGDVPAVATLFNVESRNPQGGADDDQDLTLSLAYVPATRTLTYQASPVAGGATEVSEIARLGSIRARGFS